MSLPGFTVLLLCLFFNLVSVHEAKGKALQSISKTDTTGQFYTDTAVIRFGYKQSALFHAYTFEGIDSIVDILKKNKATTLSIDGYAYKDEGSDTICYWISLNRALFLQTYILGRGIDSSRIISLHAFGKRKQDYKSTDKDGLTVNCRAELLVNYPVPPKKTVFKDSDDDGITDNEDKCPDVFGYAENNGCPDSNFVLVPFELEQSALFTKSFNVLDSVLMVLKENPSYTITIGGYAYILEGINTVCNQLAIERSDIVKQYLLSRQLNNSRIKSVVNYGNSKPRNAGKNPQEIAANARAEILFTYK